MRRDLQEFVGAVRQDGSRSRLRKGTVTAVGSAGTVTVDLGSAGAAVPVPYLLDYAPRVGDQALALVDDEGTAVVVGAYTSGPPRTQYARKTADESVTSSTTLQDDDHLVWTAQAGGVYDVRYVLFYQGSDAGDIQLTVAASTGTPTFRHTSNFLAGTTVATGPDTMIANVYGATLQHSAVTGVPVHGQVEGLWIADVAATVRLRWAQLSSNGTPTTLLTGSYVRVERIA